MKTHIRFTRLFIQPEEGETYQPSFVAYRKVPYYFEAGHIGGGHYKDQVVQWKKMLYINLWFVEFNFKWITKKLKGV